MNKGKLASINLILLFSLVLMAGSCLASSTESLKSPLLDTAETPGIKKETAVPNPTIDYEGMEWKGHISDQKDEFIKVVVNKTEWDELWKRAFGKSSPEVDFENFAVACVFLGHSADWLYHIGFGTPYMRDSLLVIPFELAELILELSAPFKASGQYHMKVFPKRKGLEIILEDTTGLLRIM